MIDTWYNVARTRLHWRIGAIVSAVLVGDLCTPLIKLANGARGRWCSPYILVGALVWEIQGSCGNLNCFRAPDKVDCRGLKSTYLWANISR